MSGRRVILYAPIFYNYWERIKEELEVQGYEVEFITYRTNKISDTFIGFNKEEKSTSIYKHIIHKRLEKLKGQWDYFLVIKGLYLDNSHLELIKERNPGIKMIMYQWDSVRNYNYRELAKFFDKVATFDFKDSEEYNYTYLPLFYTNDIVPSSNIQDIDLLLIGIFNPLRYDFLKRMKYLSKELKVYNYMVVPPTLYLKQGLLKKNLGIESIRDIKFTPINRARLLALYERSKVFVDVCSPLQTGMSMRTIEAYGMNKKLISSNSSNIQKDPWVGEIKTLPIDANDSEIIDFCRDNAIVHYKNRDKLSLKNWVRTLMD